MAYVICGKLCEIKGLRKELKIFTQSLGRFVPTRALLKSAVGVILKTVFELAQQALFYGLD